MSVYPGRHPDVVGLRQPAAARRQVHRAAIPTLYEGVPTDLRSTRGRWYQGVRIAVYGLR